MVEIDRGLIWRYAAKLVDIPQRKTLTKWQKARDSARSFSI